MASRRTLRRSTRAAAPPSNAGRKRSSFTATEAKNEFGLLLERALKGDTVVITKHNTPKAVLISIDQYRSLKRAPELQLDGLTAEFDAMFEGMQTEKAHEGMKALFSSTPADLGRAAVESARKRG